MEGKSQRESLTGFFNVSTFIILEHLTDEEEIITGILFIFILFKYSRHDAIDTSDLFMYSFIRVWNML